MTPSLHPEALPAHQLRVLRRLGPLAQAEGFYLAGGTALTLQLGHRQSLDFDWFRAPAIERPDALAASLRSEGLALEMHRTARDTLHATVEGIATSFFAYGYPLVRPVLAWAEIGCSIASVEDIACMKLVAIAQRGERKDFIDFFAIGRSGLALADALRLLQEKYRMQDIGHILVGLSYFDDAEREPMPQMLWQADWDEVKRTIRALVKAYAG